MKSLNKCLYLLGMYKLYFISLLYQNNNKKQHHEKFINRNFNLRFNRFYLIACFHFFT